MYCYLPNCPYAFNTRDVNVNIGVWRNRPYFARCGDIERALAPGLITPAYARRVPTVKGNSCIGHLQLLGNSNNRIGSVISGEHNGESAAS